MKTITINLNYTLAELAADYKLDFTYDCDEPEKWFVIGWHHNIDGDVAYATCCTGDYDTLTTFYGLTN